MSIEKHGVTELLNLTTLEWQNTVSFPGGWYHSGAALYFNGAFFVTGGVHAKFENYGNIQKFVVNTGKWETLKTGVNPSSTKPQKSVNLRLKTPRYKQSMLLIGTKLGIISIFYCIFEIFISYVNSLTYCRCTLLEGKIAMLPKILHKRNIVSSTKVSLLENVNS